MTHHHQRNIVVNQGPGFSITRKKTGSGPKHVDALPLKSELIDSRKVFSAIAVY